MFDIGWGELFLIGVVALIVVGPKDLPALFRTLGNLTGKARVMARDFQRTLEQAANESGMSEVSKNLRSLDQSINSASESARRFASQSLGTTSRPDAEGPVDAVPPAHVAAREAGPAPAPATPGAEAGAQKPKVVAKADAVPVGEAAAAAPAAPAVGESPAS